VRLYWQFDWSRVYVEVLRASLSDALRMTGIETWGGRVGHLKLAVSQAARSQDRPLQGTAEAEGVGVFAEGGDAESDVLVEGDA